eukprot:COSAG01_NODE_4727_length_4789_cov_2.948188_2_plen_143_part_00
MQGRAPTLDELLRPARATQYVVVSRLARAMSQLQPGTKKSKEARQLVAAACGGGGSVLSAMPAEEWYRQHGGGGPVPAALRGERIAPVEVCYPEPREGLAEQRRYADPFVCISAMSKPMRRAATHGLCVDGDLEACGLVSTV